jgi:DNA/RNA endonuclease G (NUC1)
LFIINWLSGFAVKNKKKTERKVEKNMGAFNYTCNENSIEVPEHLWKTVYEIEEKLNHPIVLAKVLELGLVIINDQPVMDDMLKGWLTKK